MRPPWHRDPWQRLWRRADRACATIGSHDASWHALEGALIGQCRRCRTVIAATRPVELEPAPAHPRPRAAGPAGA